MCGISGYVGHREAAPVLLDSLGRLEYRGYDSWGFATVDSDLHIKKDVGKLSESRLKIDTSQLNGTVGVAHTRWATHGGVTPNNAHPHLDCKGSIATVHNGIFVNHDELRNRILGTHTLDNETDSGVFPHMVEDLFDDGLSLSESVAEAIRPIKGTFALASIARKEPDKVVVASYKMPLSIGIGQGEFFIGSDPLAFVDFTNRAIFLEDNDVATISPDGIELLRKGKQMEDLKDLIRLVDIDASMVGKENYPFIMGKEIDQQSVVSVNPLMLSKGQLYPFVGDLISDRDIYVTGAGTSFNASLITKYLGKYLLGRHVDAVIAHEFLESAIVDSHTSVIAISQSGETADVLEAVDYAKENGARVLSIVNKLYSALARKSDAVLPIGAGPEIAVAASKSYVNQLLVLYKIFYSAAEEFGEDVHRLKEELSRMPERIQTTLNMNQGRLETISERIATENRDVYFIGRGVNYPTAMEGALKMKEISYIHAEGFPGGELKHGPLALIEDGTPLICIIPSKNGEDIKSNAHEAKARGAVPIPVLQENYRVPFADENLHLYHATVEPLHQPIVAILPLQQLAYHTAIKRGYNPDYPRNLAKSVTVK